MGTLDVNINISAGNTAPNDPLDPVFRDLLTVFAQRRLLVVVSSLWLAEVAALRLHS
ncbi:MAG: hypothetical protein MI924_03370 [Chloroflexales bacterium]|nr:hypothetical protein [Chloroflexales bacterium]